jgi:hypothetical protein
MYIKSIDQTVDRYGALLHAERVRQLQLANLDCDTGRDARVGEYPLADETYARLLDELAKDNFADLSPELRENILTFYAVTPPAITKKNQKAWQTTQNELEKLKASVANIPSE